MAVSPTTPSLGPAEAPAQLAFPDLVRLSEPLVAEQLALF